MLLRLEIFVMFRLYTILHVYSNITYAFTQMVICIWRRTSNSSQDKELMPLSYYFCVKDFIT